MVTTDGAEGLKTDAMLAVSLLELVCFGLGNVLLLCIM